jgi:hypothetical protein
LIVGTGQSLSVGYGSTPVSTEQRFGNLALRDHGPDTKYPISGGAPQYAVAPLTEPARPFVNGSGTGYTDGQYPNNVYGESPHSGTANQLSFSWASRPTNTGNFVSVHSVVGYSGSPMVNINATGNGLAYPASLTEARVFKDLADADGKSLAAGAVLLTHGESDALTPNYRALVVEL